MMKLQHEQEQTHVFLKLVDLLRHPSTVSANASLYLWVSEFAPGHPKPFFFMEDKEKRRDIHTRAANCCRDTKPT